MDQAKDTYCAVTVHRPQARGDIVLVCEHASAAIPAQYADLGLTGAALTSHAAWDPGALSLSLAMAERLDAVLVASNVSRLVYDCNRPPEATAAMPARSEIYDIPGNGDLTQAQRDARVENVYLPFRNAVATALSGPQAPVLVTIHSFTPVFHGERREVEIGILHDSDTRLADAMMETAGDFTACEVRRNDPYGPEDGVTHTLREHGLRHARPNVMIEVRNDLLQTQEACETLAATLSSWLSQSVSQMRERTV